MRGKFLQENRLLRGYDLNSEDQILKDEESNFPLSHLNPRVQQLDHHHHSPYHPHHHYLPGHHVPTYGIHRASSASSSSSHPSKRPKNLMPDPLTGISLKPIYLPRPSISNTIPCSSVPNARNRGATDHSFAPTSDHPGRLVSQSMYPYNLARLSPAERNRIFYQKRIPGGANILVNDAWMVLPFDSVRKSSCYSYASSLHEDQCDGCRRHSCPVGERPIEHTPQEDRGSSSSRGSRDSNYNKRNESDHNRSNGNNNLQQQNAYPLNGKTPFKKNNNNESMFIEEKEFVCKATIVNDVTDTKL